MKLFAVFFLTIISLRTAAQLHGRVLNEKKEGIFGASVFLLKANDSVLLKIAVTDKEGKFEFSGEQRNETIVKVFFAGYQNVFVKTDTSFLNIPLHPVENLLTGVSINYKKPLIEIKNDRVVLNIENSINALGNSGLELLRKSPGVLVDQNDNISLSGKSGVKIYIDNKPSPLASKDLASFLSSMQSSQIEAIEIISNPSSKYEASGNAGIINIRMKMYQAYGMNTAVNLGFAEGVFPKWNGAINLNYRNKKINVFGGTNFTKNISESGLSLYRRQNDSIYDQKSINITRQVSYAFRTGIDWFVNKRSTLGLLLTGNLANSFSKGHSETPISTQADGIIHSSLDALRRDTATRDNLALNLNFRSTLSSGAELNIDADYANFNFNKVAKVQNNYADKGGNIMSVYTFANHSPTSIQMLSVKSDYEKAVSKGKLSVGFKSSFVRTDNTFLFFNVINNAASLDPARSNQFIYNEQIHGGYLQYFKQQSKKINYRVGLRTEYTHSTGNLQSNIASDNKVTRSYVDLFPSASLSFQSDQKNQFALSYSRRIDRPNYQNLNPFESKIDELTYQKGNPFLRPQYTNILELRHTYMYKLSTAVSYSSINDFFAEITDTVEVSKNFITTRNIAHQKIFSVNISYPFNVTNWWSVYANLNAFHSMYQAHLAPGKDISISKTTAVLYQQQSFMIGKGWSAELSGFYNSPYVWGGTYECKAIWTLDAGFQKKLFHNQAYLKISATDIFNTFPWRGVSRLGALRIDGGGFWESRQLRVTFYQKFGSKKVPGATNRSTGLDEINKRVQ